MMTAPEGCCNMKRCSKSLVLVLLMLIVCMLTACQSSVRPENTETALNSFDRTLIVATDDDYWPYVYYDESGRLTGHDIELITVVANELKMNL